MLGTRCYLHTITVRPDFFATNDESSEEFRRLLSSQRTFGILTSKKLPNLARIALYITIGQLDVSISSDPIEIVLTHEQQHQRLRNFHSMVFREMLKINHSFLANDFTNGPNSLFVVPCLGNSIDWSIVDAFQKLEPYRIKDAQELENMRFQTEDYTNKVVKHGDTVYIVTKVLINDSPKSPFPNQDYATYADYYLAKYGKIVVNKNQFLIEVKAVSGSLYRLMPGKNVDGGRNVSYLRIVLIPELCHNYGFPGDLWLKATLLPSTFHRINFLLNAEKMRVKVNRYIGIDDSNYKPQPIVMGVKSLNCSLQSDEDSTKTAETIVALPKSIPKKVQPVQGTIACPWLEYEEPIDCTRNLQDIHLIDIDYYQHFVDNNDDMAAHIVHQMSLGASSALAVVIPPFDKKRQPIALLNIDLKTPTMGPEQTDLLACLTEKSSSDVIDLERLEVIGDAFLKFGVSLFLLQKHPDWHEGFLTSCKGQMVSNRNLCYVAMDRNLGGLMKVSQFSPKDNWTPPLFAVPKEIKVYKFSLTIQSITG